MTEQPAGRLRRWRGAGHRPRQRDEAAQQVVAVLDQIAREDAPAVELARHLLDTGWRVEECWGPQQMGVWMLIVARGRWRVSISIERGYSNGGLRTRRGWTLGA